MAKSRLFPKAYLLLLTGLLLAACSREVEVSGVQCYEMMYACGDCYTICKVIDSESPHLQKGEEFLYRFASEEMDAAFSNDNAICMICAEYEFSGTLLIDKEPKVLIVSSYSISFREGCCSSMP